MRYALLKEIKEGASLIPVVKHLNQDKIDKFGQATGSIGFIHVVPEYCAVRPMKKTLAHAFLNVAYASEVMEINFGKPWQYTGVIEAKFVGQAHPGDVMFVNGTITSIEEVDGKKKVSCDIKITNQDDKTIVVATTSVCI